MLTKCSEGLEALYQKYKDRGFVVLGFPSDDFKQEYDQAEKTAEVCYLNYGVTFPMFTKTLVTGELANTFFKGLAEATGTAPGWNGSYREIGEARQAGFRGSGF